VNDDRSGPAKNIEQDFDALMGSHDAEDSGLKSVKRALGNGDTVAALQVALAVLNAVLRKPRHEVGNDLIGDGGEAVTKMDDRADAGGVLDLVKMKGWSKAREEVVGEEGFDESDGASAGGLAQAEARAEDGNLMDEAEVGGGDVFALGLGTDAEPAWFRGELRGWELVHRFVFRRLEQDQPRWVSIGSRLAGNNSQFLSNCDSRALFDEWG